MGLKPGYKQTEVGVIPKDWEVRPLLSVVKPATGQVDPRNEPYSSMVLVAPDHIEEGTGRLLKKETASEQGAISGKYHFKQGDIVYSKIRPYLRKAILADFEGLCSADMYPLTAEKDVCSAFLLPVLLGHHFSSFAATVSARSGIPKINREELAQYKVTLPPLAEQRAIAEALSDVDALVGALEGLIAKRRDLKQAAMQQLLTGQKRLPGFSGEWEVKSLFELAGHSKELFDDGDWIEAEYLTESGIRLVQTGNMGEGNFIDRDVKKFISADSFKKLRCKELQIGDILICRLADPAGRACILPDIGEQRMITAVDITIFRPLPSLASRRFLVNVFSTRQWFERVAERCGGSTRTRVARNELGKMEIKIPSLPEQNAIAEVLSDMDAEITALERRRDKTGALKQGMMQELLTGRTRLV